MGVRAGQGYGVPKPKRAICPECSKKGVTQPKLCMGTITASWVRNCQYCGGSWTELSWDIAKKIAAQQKEKDQSRPPSNLEGIEMTMPIEPVTDAEIDAAWRANPAVEVAVTAEREACALVCESRAGMRGTGAWEVLISAAEAIRDRARADASGHQVTPEGVARALRRLVDAERKYMADTGLRCDDPIMEAVVNAERVLGGSV